MKNNGVVGEDIHIKNINLLEDEQESLLNTVKYFMFNGTGSNKSKYICNAVLEIDDPNSIDNWKYIMCNDEISKLDYIKSIFNRLVLYRANQWHQSLEKIAKKKVVFILDWQNKS